MDLTAGRALILSAFTAGPGSPSADALNAAASRAATHEQAALRHDQVAEHDRS